MVSSASRKVCASEIKLRLSVILSAALIGGAIVWPCHAVELFGPRLSVSLGDGPSHATSADFDGNGVADLAVANSGDGTVTVVLADGQGGFEVAPPVELELPDPNAIAAGDFNADGMADLAVTHLWDDALSVLLGDGTGGFSVVGEVAVGSRPTFVGADDFDFDGTTDLVVANGGHHTVTVLSGNGDGDFSLTAEIATGSFPRAIGIADLNGDGPVDLAVANMWSSSISILIGDGFGGFEPAPEVMVGENGEDRRPNSIVVDDFDLDGDADLAVANAAADSVSILLGDGQGGFGAVRDVPDVGDSPAWLAAGDFDDDGDADLAVTDLAGNTVRILRGNPALIADDNDYSGFDTTGPIRIQENPRSAVVGDFTGDGAVDLAVVLAGSDLMTLLPGNGLGGFDPVQQIPDVPLSMYFQDSVACIEAADFNKDGHADVAVTSREEGVLVVYLADGEGGFKDGTRSVVPSPWCMAVNDWNGDGIPDVAVAVSGGGIPGQVHVLLGDGQGRFEPGQVTPVGVYPTRVVSGDFDGDGDADIGVVNVFSSSVSILLGDGSGSFAVSREMVTGGWPHSAVLADFDGDGTPDLAACNIGGQSVSLHPALADWTAERTLPVLNPYSITAGEMLILLSPSGLAPLQTSIYPRSSGGSTSSGATGTEISPRHR
jgi:hypothetical protein